MTKILYEFLIIICVIEFIKCISINYQTYCPSGYEQVPNTTMCALITSSKVPYKDLCLNIGQQEPDAYNKLITNNSTSLIKYLKQRRLKNVWLPIQKNVLSILAWKLPLPTWNRRVDTINSTNLPKNYQNGDCVLYMVDDGELMVENCENVHYQLCLFNQRDKHYVITNLCDTTTVTSRFSKFHSFCFELEEFNWTLPNDNESIAFIGSEDKLVAIDQYIDYHQGLDQKIQIETNLVSNITSGHVTVLENHRIELAERQAVSIRVVEKNIKTTLLNHRVTIQIMHDPSLNILIVNIRNYKFLWTIDIRDHSPVKCYTDADLKKDLLDEIYPNSTKIGPNIHMTITLPKNMGIGNYWCEGQKLLTLETIKSNHLTIIDKKLQVESHIFCIYAKKTCNLCNFYDAGEIDNFGVYGLEGLQPPRWENKPLIEFQELQLKKVFTSHDNIAKVLIHAHMHIPNMPLNHAEDLQAYRRIINYGVSFRNSFMYEYIIYEIRVFDTCFSQNLTFFANAKLNTISVFKSFCILNSGLPPIQKCIGNQFDGAYWEHEYNITTILDSCDQSRMTGVTKELFTLNEELRLSNETKEQTINIIERTVAAVASVIHDENEKSSEVQYAAITLNNLISSTKIDIFEMMKDGNTTSTILEPVTQIIDNLLERERHSLVEDPNRILATIDALSLKYAESEVTKKVFLESDDGVILVKKPNIILMIVNPAIKNISGIALYKTKNNIHSLNDYSVRKLQGHEKAVHIYNESLELSIQIPTSSLSKMQIDQGGHMMPPKRIIFKIFYKNSLFDETQIDPETGVASENVDINSKVVSISVSNYTGFEATRGLFVMFRTERLNVRRSKQISKGCSDFSTAPGSTENRWNRDLTKCKEIGDNIVLCPVKRLQHIGYVTLCGNIHQYSSKILIAILYYTTVIGCLLSIIGIVIIFLTAILFEKWKRREATPLVLNVSVATFLQIIMFNVAESQILISTKSCIIIGGILHYFVLVALFISLFVADCQYRRYVRVLGSAVTDKFKTKLFLVGWLVPFIMVAGCILIQPNSYLPSEEIRDLGSFCYPTNLILICFVHVPILTIFCINLSIYIWIIVRLTREDPFLRKTPKKSNIVNQIRLFFFIFMVLSLTWIFGLLAYYTELYAFSFLFNLFAPMQGFCLFVFCCLFDEQTRKFWLKQKLCKK